MTDDDTDGVLLMPSLRRHYRYESGWRSRDEQYAPKIARMSVDSIGSLTEEMACPNQWPAPGAQVAGPGQQFGRRDFLDASWKPFFPNVPDAERLTYDYPLPLSDEFWQAYSEPVDVFISTAADLHLALRNLRGRESSTETKSEYRARIRAGQSALNELAYPISACLVANEKGQFRQRWVSTSLLGSLAMMALLDVAGDGRVLTCPVCLNLFTSKSSKAKYCSRTCRNTQNVRATRARNKQKGSAKSGTV